MLITGASKCGGVFGRVSEHLEILEVTKRHPLEGAGWLLFICCWSGAFPDETTSLIPELLQKLIGTDWIRRSPMSRPYLVRAALSQMIPAVICLVDSVTCSVPVTCGIGKTKNNQNHS